MRLRWLLIASHVPPGGALGGMVRYTVELAAALAADPDVELHVLADPGAAQYWADLIGDSSRVHRLVSLPSAGQALLERNSPSVRNLCDTFDVVQGTKHIIPRRCAATTVLTVHDLLPLDRPRDFGFLKRTLLPGPYLRSAAEANVLVCVSAATRDRLLSYLPDVAHRTAVVPLANASEGLTRATATPIAELADRTFALVVGDSSRRKNLPFVVDAWPRVRRQVPDATLAVVGPPSWVDSRVGQGTVDPGVLILGRIDDDALRWAYSHAHVVLCPSLLEGFGLPSVEGLREGTPVITSDDPALCEASGDVATHLSSLAQDQWVGAIVEALRRRRSVSPPPVRSWAMVAAETVAAVKERRHD